MTSSADRRSRGGYRAAILAFAAISAIAGTLVVAYELALARVPEHRAALERLVRAQTGLDVRFNELGLRWGWYGPEAVFSRVELGEPGRSNVLLRAPQLVVGFDAWKTMQTGQLAAGRITLVAPDIDLERLTHESPESAPVAGVTQSPRAAAASSLASRARILERWRGGRIDLQGGTLRVPDPNGSKDPLTVQVRRVSLRHANDEWSGFGLVYLPERLGRAARLAVQIQGDLDRPQTWSGGIRFDGNRLAFAGWRAALASHPQLTRNFPVTGVGDLMFQLTLKDGRVERANGDLKANDLMFRTPPWIESDDSGESDLAHRALSLDYLSGEWRYVSRRGGGQVQLEQLVLSRTDKETPVPRVSVEFSDGHIHGTVPQAPLRSIAALAQWFTPDLIPAGVLLKGDAQDLDFDWNTSRVEGERLAASAHADDAGFASTSGSFKLSDVPTRIVGSESRVVIELAAPAAKLESKAFAADSVGALKLTSVLQLTRGDSGWRLSTDRLTIDHDAAKMELNGSLVAGDSGGAPVLDLHGSVAKADIMKLRDVWPENAQSALGPAFARLLAGHIENAKFTWQGPLDAEDVAVKSGDAFKGALTLQGARIAAEGAWPETHAVDAHIEWTGSMIRASLDEGRAGPFELEGIQAEWDAKGTRASHITGRARARIEKALTWVRTNPQVQEHTPHLQDLSARGDALFDFDVSIPREGTLAPRSTPPKTRARIAALLEGVELALAPQMPPIQSLRGTLAFDFGRLQGSTLNATWLGGPVTLKVSERRNRLQTGVAVQAQGIIEASKLVALSQFRSLPDVAGETSWSGDFFYMPPEGEQAARWQGHVDSNLIGVTSDLPAPLNKLAQATVPLRVELNGSGEASDVRVNLAERVRSSFALALNEQGEWDIDHGTLRITTTGTTASGARQFVTANLQANPSASGTDLSIESDTLGLVTGTMLSGTSGFVVKDVKWSRETLSGEGSMHCEPALATCDASFNVSTDSLARALADLGFRPDVAAAKGTLSGALTWRPRAERSFLETASGRLSLSLEDGIARSSVSSAGRPFPLLTVPALLSGIARSPASEAMTSGEMRFKSLDAEFDLKDGVAVTNNLHFDGDAEILMRGRTGLVTRDYDHEAWVLRGEERIPASLRRLAATPRVAAAWMALRELIRPDAADRSHVVLHLRGSWSEPVVSVD